MCLNVCQQREKPFSAQIVIIVRMMMIIIATTISILIISIIVVIIIITYDYHNYSSYYSYDARYAEASAQVILPVAIGMGVRSFSSRWANILEKVASVVGMLFIVAALVAGIITNQHVFTESWKLWLASAVLMPIGGIMGYTNARLARLPANACRTICLETGLQNSTLALAILAFSFPDAETFSAVSVFPLLYSLFLLIDGVLITIAFRYISRGEEYISEGKTPTDSAPARQESQDVEATVEDKASEEEAHARRFESVV